MPKLHTYCLAAVLLLQLPMAAVHAAPVAASVEQDVAARIDAAIAPYYKAADPGATLIVVKDGKTVLRKAYGMADVGNEVAMKPGATLRLGSITKQFTAAGILMLAEEGKLSVSDPITKYLPDYPTKGKNITIEHLLTHTSGIVSYTGKQGFREQSNKNVTVAQMIDYFKDEPLEFEPGTRFAYNNSGYFLLGAIIEKVSGQSYAKFVEERIFAPLNMRYTGYEGQERDLTLRAAGHSKEKGNFAPAPSLSMSQPYAAGALVSTVDDLAKWDAAIASGKLLKASSWAQAFTPYKLADGKSTGYGYGWQVGKVRGATEIAHGGGINGFSTYALRVPEQKLFVALLTNSDSGFVQPAVVAKRVAAAAMGNPYPELKAVAMDAAALDAFAGTYKEDKVTRTVRRDGDHLTMQRSGRGPMPIYPMGGDTFFIKDSLTTVKFVRGANGSVSQLVLDDENTQVASMRTGDAPAERTAIAMAPAALDSFAGRYEVRPGFVLELKRDGDKFFGNATGQPTFQLVPVAENTFYVKEVDAEIRFSGKDQLVLAQGGRDLQARRMP